MDPGKPCEFLACPFKLGARGARLRIQMQDGYYTFANYLVDTIVDALLHHWIVTGDWSILCPLEQRHSVRTVAVALAVARCGGGAHWRCLTLFPSRGTEDVDVFNERPMFRAHLYEAKRLPITVAVKRMSANLKKKSDS